MRTKVVGVWKTEKEKIRGAWEYNECQENKWQIQERKVLTTVGKWFSLRGHNLHQCVPETNDGISHRKTFALKGNNAYFVFKWKTETEEFDNFNFTGNAEKTCVVSYLEKEHVLICSRFWLRRERAWWRVTQLLELPQGSSDSPVPVLALQGSWW